MGLIYFNDGSKSQCPWLSNGHCLNIGGLKFGYIYKQHCWGVLGSWGS